jgi:APA family basic amino acid/polyamine antiporter
MTSDDPAGVQNSAEPDSMKELMTESKKRFFVRKDVSQILADADKSDEKLKRTLTAVDVTAFGIGSIIGAGIFVLSGVAAGSYAGPAVLISFIIAGIVCTFVALCYAEFASMIPIAGSAYTYSYATMGELIAWVIGWDLILEYTVGATAVSVGWSGYIVELFGSVGIHLPTALTNGPFVEGGAVNLPAVGIILFLVLILVMGSKESSKLNLTFVLIKVSVLIFIIILGATYFTGENLEPFMPFGVKGIFSGAAIVFFAYIGFDAVSTTAEEVKNPGRDLPIGILASLIISTALYMAAAAVLVGMVPFYELQNTSAPFAYAFSFNHVYWAAAVISAGALAGITSVLLVSLYAQPRVLFSLARDGLIPKGIAKVHPHYGTPHRAIIVTGLVVATCAAILPIEEAAKLVNIGTLFAFVLVCTGIIILRRTDPHLKRPFRVPFVPWIPLAGAGSSFALMVFLPMLTWLRFILWLGIGILIYANYGYYHSRLAKKNDEK